MPQSSSISSALALWACVAITIIMCARTAEAACGCSPLGAQMLIPSSSSSSNSKTGKTSTNNDRSDDTPKGVIRVDDMLIPVEDLEIPMSAEGSPEETQFSGNPNRYINCVRPWPNGTLYYRFDTRYPTSRRTLIRQSLDILESRTDNAVTFVEIENTVNMSHVVIVDKSGCWSYIGKMYSTASQELSLDVPGCMLESIVQHEFMHALGFSHEHSRLDRDNYVQIVWYNIDSYSCSNFAKRAFIIPSDFPSYDYDSVMHYTSTAFACIRYWDTIVMLNGSTIDVRTNLTDFDVAKLKYIYSESNLDYCFGPFTVDNTTQTTTQTTTKTTTKTTTQTTTQTTIETKRNKATLSGTHVAGSLANVVTCLLTICCCIDLLS